MCKVLECLVILVVEMWDLFICLIDIVVGFLNVCVVCVMVWYFVECGYWCIGFLVGVSELDCCGLDWFKGY